MVRLTRDARGFVEVTFLRGESFSRAQAAVFRERLLAWMPPQGRLRILMRVEEALPAGIEWRAEFVKFVAKHRPRLRVAVRRPGYHGDGLTRWARRIGFELREFAGDDEAARWLVADTPADEPRG